MNSTASDYRFAKIVGILLIVAIFVHAIATKSFGSYVLGVIATILLLRLVSKAEVKSS